MEYSETTPIAQTLARARRRVADRDRLDLLKYSSVRKTRIKMKGRQPSSDWESELYDRRLGPKEFRKIAENGEEGKDFPSCKNFTWNRLGNSRDLKDFSSDVYSRHRLAAPAFIVSGQADFDGRYAQLNVYFCLKVFF